MNSSRLVILLEGEAKVLDLSETDVIIGRLPECEVQLPSNLVSRKHARVFKDGERYCIEDLGSGNGTFVNGQKIQEVRPLKPNDRMKFGPILIRFESDEPAGSASDSIQQLLREPVARNNVEISEDQGSVTATILGSLDNQGRSNLLDVRPQEKLRAVLEISRALAGTHEVEKLLPRILDSLFQIFPAADRGVILLKDSRSGEMVSRAMKHRRESEDASVKLSRTILNSVLEQKKAILSADAITDSRFDASESISSLTIRSMMCVPMLDLQGEPLGIINIDTQNPLAQFKSEDLDIMLTVAGQAALTYESAKLLQSYIQKQKQDNEMNIARNVQHALLPEHLPNIDGYEFFASYDSAQAVGGDYYDIIATKDGRIWLAFGDVAGKGVPASLVMSRMSSVVRSVSEFVTDAAEAVSRINDHMCSKAVEGRFVTFVLLILDIQAHKLWLVNAGHMSPMIRKSDGSIEEFPEEAVGVPIGVLEGFPFEAVERDLSPGETIVIYTDGVSEAMNSKNDLYTIERLREFVAKGAANPAQLGVGIREDVRKHANGHEQNDDITLMVVGRTSIATNR
ncbi:SpoIIE family protein phosphatase [Planctomicrobium sp. SH668]|uniref:SpoIIE family protein phosphatase n=1 Tax=Planctomicrobium sp. SH668 TaxID=3448126 RepID=UPI003F5C8990